MNAMLEASPSVSPPLSEALEAVAREYVEQWLTLCGGFMRWHREHCLRQEPEEQTRRECARVLPWLIRVSRMIHGQMLDPAWPHPELARQVEGRLWQLEEVWAQLHNPMSEAEADALIAKHFPDAPGA